MTETTTTSRQRSLEQERAKAAWKAVLSAKQKGEDYQKKYKPLARGAPANIQQNGLGQTLAFWLAKPKEDQQKDLYASVSTWVKSQINWPEAKELLPWIVEHAETDQYRRATSEAIAFLNWVKRFAEAELKGEV